MELSFFLFASSDSSINIFLFLICIDRPFISFIRFIPRYFVLFDLIVNEITFFISLSYSSLLMHINAIDCVSSNFKSSFINSSNGFIDHAKAFDSGPQ